MSELIKFKLPIPPLDVQKVIVAEIEAIERDEENDRAAVEATQTRLNATISGFENSVAVDSVCTVRNQKIEPADIAPDWVYVGLEHIESQTGRLSELPNAVNADLQSTKNFFQKGDVLYGKLRPNLNKVVVAPADGVCSTDIMVLQTTFPSLLQKILLHADFVAQSSAAISGTQLPRLNPKDFARLKVHYPVDATASIAAVQAEEAVIAAAQARLEGAAARKAATLTAHL